MIMRAASETLYPRPFAACPYAQRGIWLKSSLALSARLVAKLLHIVEIATVEVSEAGRFEPARRRGRAHKFAKFLKRRFRRLDADEFRNLLQMSVGRRADAVIVQHESRGWIAAHKTLNATVSRAPIG